MFRKEDRRRIDGESSTLMLHFKQKEACQRAKNTIHLYQLW